MSSEGSVGEGKAEALPTELAGFASGPVRVHVSVWDATSESSSTSASGSSTKASAAGAPACVKHEVVSTKDPDRIYCPPFSDWVEYRTKGAPGIEEWCRSPDLGYRAAVEMGERAGVHPRIHVRNNHSQPLDVHLWVNGVYVDCRQVGAVSDDVFDGFADGKRFLFAHEAAPVSLDKGSVPGGTENGVVALHWVARHPPKMRVPVESPDGAEGRPPAKLTFSDKSGGDDLSLAAVMHGGGPTGAYRSVPPKARSAPAKKEKRSWGKAGEEGGDESFSMVWFCDTSKKVPTASGYAAGFVGASDETYSLPPGKVPCIKYHDSDPAFSGKLLLKLVTVAAEPGGGARVAHASAGAAEALPCPVSSVPGT
jgi:hypothetical protein